MKSHHKSHGIPTSIMIEKWDHGVRAMGFLFGVLTFVTLLVVPENLFAADLRVAGAKGVYCNIRHNCSAVGRDHSERFKIGNVKNAGSLTVTTYDVGEPGTAAAGLYLYSFRVRLNKFDSGFLLRPSNCVSGLVIPFGNIIKRDFDKDGTKDDIVYHLDSGGISYPRSAETNSKNEIVLRLAKPVCAGGGTKFISVLSARAPRKEKVVAKVLLRGGQAINTKAVTADFPFSTVLDPPGQVTIPGTDPRPPVGRLLFNFAFGQPVLPAPAGFKNRNLICDSYCNITKIRTPVLRIGWPVGRGEGNNAYRLDFSGDPLGFEKDTFFSTPFASQFNDVAASPQQPDRENRARFKKLGESSSYFSGREFTYVSVEGFRGSLSYQVRLLKRTPNGWRPEAFNVCSVPVCPADNIRQ